MALILSLRPNVTRENAIEHFTGRGLAKLANRIVRGPLYGAAELYIPFGIFRFRVEDVSRTQISVFAMDLVQGNFDLYELPSPDVISIMQVETRNVVESPLSPAAAVDDAVSRLRRMVFLRGFFRLSRRFRISAEPVRLDLHVPYWIGIWRRAQTANIAVLDAVRGRREGARVRHFITDWLHDGNKLG